MRCRSVRPLLDVLTASLLRDLAEAADFEVNAASVFLEAEAE